MIKGSHNPHLQRARIGICPVCKGTFRAVSDHTGRFGGRQDRQQKYCSKLCWKNRGAQIITRTCPLCAVQFTTQDKRKKYCSRTCSLSSYRGNGSHFWKGGATDKNQIERSSARYAQWRMEVFKRDSFTCQLCGKKDRTIQADHIKPFAHHPELRYELSNGRTLCHDCHKQTPTYGRKSTPLRLDK